MSLICDCPAATAITSFASDACLERFGQIQRFGVQRTKSAGALNEIVIATDDPEELATWTALKAAVDSTKVQFSTFIQEPAAPAGEAREYGGGNATIGGTPILLGSNPTPFSAAFLDVKQSVILSMKGLMCEKELSVFLITENGQIIGLTDNHTTPTTFRGIPIKSFYLSDKQMGMFEEPDKNFVRWSFVPGWSDYLYAVSPSDFEALTEL